jgi:hypothetical protein
MERGVRAKSYLHARPDLLTEAQLSGLVVELARIAGWLRYHTFDSRRSNHGFPDWVFVKGSRILFVELKSQTGRVSDKQQAWLDALEVVPCAEVFVWRPGDWDSIVETLTGRKPVRAAA